MTEINTIGIAGEDGAGKSTVASIIAELLGSERSVTRMAFADDLKLMLRELDPILGAHRIGSDAEEIRLSDLIDDGYSEADIKSAYPEYRRLLRTLGTRCIRERDDIFWVTSLSERIDELKLGNDDVVVIDDIRFWNEAEEVHYGLMNWRRYNDGKVIKVVGRGTGSGQGEELAEIEANAVLVNDGTPEELRVKVREVLLEWGFNL